MVKSHPSDKQTGPKYEGAKVVNLKIGDTVRALADSDGIDTLDTNIPYEVFNFIEHESRVGIKSGSYWFYLKPDELELW